MKGNLLGSGFLNDLIKVSSVDGVAEMLQRTNYKNDLSQAAATYQGSQMLELACGKNFVRTIDQLTKFIPKSDRPAVEALLLKWDLMNLRIIMRAKKFNQEYDAVKPSLFFVGGLSEDDCKRILKADDKNFVKELKKTRIGTKLASEPVFYQLFSSPSSFIANEPTVDRYSYQLVQKALQNAGAADLSAIAEVLRKEVDAKNLLIIERLKKQKVDKSKIVQKLILGGTLNDQTIKKLIDAKDFSFLNSIIKSKFGSLSVKENLSLSELEVTLEKALAIKKSRAFHRAMLSVGVIIGFVLLKEEEINNIRKISKAKEFGISEADVRDMLVIV
ncbi:V-type ATPase subunit [Candidatus Micrarchaeota archaeon]|nr:V-type ATPase subunit [Candidatus Micrarchaeota archaeon]